MNQLKMGLIASIAIFSGSPGAFAQDDLIDYLVTECEGDIENYCSKVTPGNGRLLHCMAAHEDKISGQCSYALYRAASLLEQLAVAINYVAQECRTDIETHCGEVVIGENRVLSCLADHEAELAESCKTALAGTSGE
jgi:Golgi apparatus protein 1